MEVHDVRRHYAFQLVGLKFVGNSSVPARPGPAVSTSRQQFERGKAAYAGGALGRVEAMGNVFSDAEKEAIRERQQKRNNPLELR